MTAGAFLSCGIRPGAAPGAVVRENAFEEAGLLVRYPFVESEVTRGVERPFEREIATRLLVEIAPGHRPTASSQASDDGEVGSERALVDVIESIVRQRRR
jgi:hypothetical protein